MGACCCPKSCQNACEPCCRRLGCSCKQRDSENRADIEKNRACTDMLFIAVFGAFLIYMVSFIWAPAYTDGNPDRYDSYYNRKHTYHRLLFHHIAFFYVCVYFDRLIRGVDWQGRICGVSSGVENRKLAYWPSPVDSTRFQVCTDTCDDTMYLYNRYGLSPYISSAYLEKYCLPSDGSETTGNVTNADTSAVLSAFNGNTEKISRQIGDINTALPVIGASIAISFAMSFFYIGLMKMCVAILVWSTIVIILVVEIYFGWVFYAKASEIELAGGDPDDVSTNQYISYAIWGVTAICFVIIIFARNRIKIAIEVIKSASRSLKDMPLMVLFPIWPLLFVVGFFMAWLYGSVYIYSNGSQTQIDAPTNLQGKNFGYGDVTTAQFTVLDYDQTTRGAFAPHFFLLLWVNQTCVYITFITISGAVADWYFTKRDEKGKKIRGTGEGELTPSPVFSSCKRAFRYHMGTILFASGLVAVVQFIRYAIRYMERMANGGRKPNQLQKLLMKLTDCCLWCLECCLDKISRNALIFTAIYGDPFCPACVGSWTLIWANLLRVGVITFFSTIVTGLGKILIPLFTAVVCGSVLVYVDPWKSQLDSIYFPLLIIVLISIAIGLLFLTVYDTAIDTVFVCFLIDETANGKRGIPMLADEGLRNIVQKYEDESKKLAEDMQRGGNQVATEEAAQTNSI